jgi:uncharacterized OB-fold protein
VSTNDNTGIKWNVTSAERPLPDLTEADTGGFWAAAQEHRLTYAMCRACGSVIFYPRSHCTTCLSEDVETGESAGQGRIYSYTVIHRNPDPAFSAMTPYVVALVDLAEGFRLMTHIKDDPGGVQVGQPVSLRWETVGGFELPVFTKADGQPAER